VFSGLPQCRAAGPPFWPGAPCQPRIARLGGYALGHNAQVARRNDAPQTKRGPPGLVNRWRTASVNAIGTSLAESAATPREAAATAAGGAAPPTHAAATAAAHGATQAAAGTPGDAASAASSAAPASGAATASSAALRKLHAELRRVGRLAVVNEELGKGDVGELFLSEGDHRKRLLRRGLLAIKNGGRRTARHRQRHACSPPHRQRRSRTFSHRSLLRACHRTPLIICENSICENSVVPSG